MSKIEQRVIQRIKKSNIYYMGRYKFFVWPYKGISEIQPEEFSYLIKELKSLIPKETQTIITGDLANREIVEKVIPQFPYWAKTKGVGATIALRFTVMQNGIVKETVIVEKTSGSLQWDQMVISALKKWKFVPITSGGLRQDQTGVITFQFVI